MKAFEFASEAVKQMLVIASSIVAFTVTFAKESTAARPRAGRNLVLCWILFGASVVFGLWTMYAFAGELQPAEPERAMIFHSNVRLPAILQLLTFCGGGIFLVLWGAREFRLRGR